MGETFGRYIALLLMLLFGVAGLSLNYMYVLKVIVIGAGSLTMMPSSIIKVVCDRYFLPKLKFIFKRTVSRLQLSGLQ